MKPYYEDENGILYCGDCLKVMQELDIKVDAVITDPPYGTTACKWDSVIPFEPMWENLMSLCNNNTPIVFFAGQPFTSKLVTSNIKKFKYSWVWQKDKPSNFALANKQPMKYHEDIVVFYDKQPTYNKQMQPRTGSGENRYKYVVDNSNRKSNHSNMCDEPKFYNPKLKNPSSVQSFSTGRRQDLLHPTQKPVALIEYLIKTYTNEYEIVLDFCCGSGTTAIACMNTNRKYICIEKEEKYCEIAKDRIIQHKENM